MRVVRTSVAFILFVMLSNLSLGQLGFPNDSERKLGELGKIMKESKVKEKLEEWMRGAKERLNRTSEFFRKKWLNATSRYLEAIKNNSIIGKILFEKDYALGNFVKFMFNDSSIMDYTLLREENFTVFDLIYVEGFGEAGKIITKGSVWFAEGNSSSIEIHDNPTALIKIISRHVCYVTFFLSSGMIANQTSSKMIELSGKIEGKIVLAGEGALRLQNNTVSVNLSKSSNVIFIAHPEKEATIKLSKQDLHEKILVKKLSEGKLCARIMISNINESDAMDFFNITSISKFEKGAIKVIVNGTGKEKIIAIDISSKVFNTSKLIVKLDGQSLPMVEYDALLNSTDEESRCAILEGEKGMQVLVYIASFSQHVIDIFPYVESEKKTPAIGLPLLILCIAIAIILRRKLGKEE